MPQPESKSEDVLTEFRLTTDCKIKIKATLLKSIIASLLIFSTVLSYAQNKKAE